MAADYQQCTAGQGSLRGAEWQVQGGGAAVRGGGPCAFQWHACMGQGAAVAASMMSAADAAYQCTGAGEARVVNVSCWRHEQ